MSPSLSQHLSVRVRGRVGGGLGHVGDVEHLGPERAHLLAVGEGPEELGPGAVVVELACLG
jgi:hypothetical protein